MMITTDAYGWLVEEASGIFKEAARLSPFCESLCDSSMFFWHRR